MDSQRKLVCMACVLGKENPTIMIMSVWISSVISKNSSEYEYQVSIQQIKPYYLDIKPYYLDIPINIHHYISEWSD